MSHPRLELLHKFPCMACEKDGNKQPNRTEAHHLVWFGKRRGHDYTIPLCGWHHRGEPLMFVSCTTMADLYGPSLARSKRAFVDRYGTEDQLLKEIDERIEPFVGYAGGTA